MVTTLSDTCKGIVPCPVIPARSRRVLLLFSSSAPLVGLQPASSLIYLWGMSHTCVPFARPCTPKASARGETPSRSWHRGFGHSHHPEQAQLCAVLPSPAPVGYWKPVTAGGPTGGRGQVPETLGKAEKVKIPSEAVAGAGSAGLSLVLV